MTRGRYSSAAAKVFARMAGPDADVVLANAKDPSRVSGGRKARDRGDELEEWLGAQHERAIAKGILARMRKVGPPIAPHAEGGSVSHDRRGRLLVAVDGLGPADFQGQLLNGRTIALEAKSRDGRLVRDEDIPEHQQSDLNDCAFGAGVAVLVYRCTAGTRERTFVMPWRDVPWCSPRGGSPSIGPGDVERWEVGAASLHHPLDARWAFYLLPLLQREASGSSMKFVEPWEEARAELLAAGWTKIPGSAGNWRDPASGESYGPWRALEICRRDREAKRKEEAARGEGTPT